MLRSISYSNILLEGSCTLARKLAPLHSNMAKLYSNSMLEPNKPARLLALLTSCSARLATAQLRHARMQHRQIKLYGMGLLRAAVFQKQNNTLLI